MCMKLSEMSLEELWELFPIQLTPHNPYWSDWYAEEVRFLKKLLPSEIEYYHIGSTAIKDIYAKPIIDIILEVSSVDLMKRVALILEKNGYIAMSKKETRISMNKGYTEDGFAEKVFHLHLRQKGDTDEIYFRDYLNGHSDVAKDYEKLKLSLLQKYEHDRDGYTNAKTEFVTKYTIIAKTSVN